MVKRITVTQSKPASTNGVAALDRAIAILDAFATADRSLSLAEIAARTGLY
ncbi:MAG: IclR family transcriptional regulator, partial [Mesorhizobium sp.]